MLLHVSGEWPMKSFMRILGCSPNRVMGVSVWRKGNFDCHYTGLLDMYTLYFRNSILQRRIPPLEAKSTLLSCQMRSDGMALKMFQFISLSCNEVYFGMDTMLHVRYELKSFDVITERCWKVTNTFLAE